MNDELKSEVQASVQKEYERASKKFGAVNNSNHESYAVIKEEYEEALAECDLFGHYLDYYWEIVKGNSERDIEERLIAMQNSREYAFKLMAKELYGELVSRNVHGIVRNAFDNIKDLLTDRKEYIAELEKLNAENHNLKYDNEEVERLKAEVERLKTALEISQKIVARKGSPRMSNTCGDTCEDMLRLKSRFRGSA